VPEESGPVLGGLLGRLRGLVLHPAFAYAVVLALLYPTARWVLDDLGPLRTLPAADAERALEPAEPERPGREAVEPLRPSGELRASGAGSASGLGLADAPSAPAVAPPTSAGSERLAGRADKDSAAKQTRARPPPQLAMKRPRAAEEDEAAEVARAEPAARAADRLAPTPAREKQEAPLESEGALRFEAALAAPQGGKARLSQPRSDSLTTSGAAAVPAPALRFDSADSSLSVPLPGDVAPGDVVEIRVASVDGTREIRERFAIEAGAERFEMRLPASWMTPGIYRVERRVIGVDASIERTSEFRVEIP
jgi:hypothetical protein